MVAPSSTSRSVTFLAFLDENRNGVLDASESMRIPGVEISFGAASGRTAVLTGMATFDALQTAQSLSVNPATLPPYHRGPETTTLTPPLSGTFNVPITLLVGSGGTPGVYLAFGDSITNGQAFVGDGQGYIGLLERQLTAHFGKARVISDGLDSSNSERGLSRLPDSLAGGRPGLTLILYGTNDWADSRCTFSPPCFTIENLRSMVRTVKGRGGFPFLATLLMTDVNNDFRGSPQRNTWIETQNVFIRQMAVEEDVVLVDLHGAFERAPLQYSQLFHDYIHPSPSGYQLVAQTWFNAITKPR